jgi:hypothetical protein
MQQETNFSSVGGNGHGGTRMVDRIKDQTAAQLNSQKNKATDGLGTVATAVRETTHNLRNQQHDVAARYVEQAADQIERFSNRLREKDITELLGDAQRFARRRPALFVGAAFGLGLLGSRFLKSSAESQRFDDDTTMQHYPRATTPPPVSAQTPVDVATERL